MGKPETCQHVFKVEDAPWPAAMQCEATVSNYRSCGAGCKLVIAYCDSHGGDKRAVGEMIKHTLLHPIEEKTS